MSAERILYPCYFDAALQRREGRRVPKRLSVKSPNLPAIEAALRKMKVPYRLEQQHHPARWAEREGRAVVEWDGSKEELIQRVAEHLRNR